ncbi:MAG: hypothetical protein FJX23_04575 [Alphaproteobacteria bacterium]|nr:hypothetical protein [Alphaproteobacteria bacterium]
MSASPSFLGFVNDPANLAVLQQFVKSQGWDASRAQLGDADGAVAYLASHPTPDFLLVEIKDAASAPAALDKLADVCAPNVKVIVTSTVDEFSFFRWLKDIGVHHYLLKPLTVEALAESITVQSTAEPSKSPVVEKEGELIAVIGTRGGVGASSLALNLASAFSDVIGRQTALLDLEPQWGTISLMLDLEPGRGLRDALAKPDRIDSLFMERVMLRYSPTLSVLSSEEPLDEIITTHPDAASALLRETRKKFSVVIADLPHAMSGFTLDVLKAADQVVIATELSIISLRDAMRLHDFLKTKLGLKHIHFVANRQGMLPKYELPAAEFEKSLGTKLSASIPFDGENLTSMASGNLAVSQKTQSHPLAKAVIALARKLDTSEATVDEPSKPKSKGLGWLMGKK